MRSARTPGAKTNRRETRDHARKGGGGSLGVEGRDASAKRPDEERRKPMIAVAGRSSRRRRRCPPRERRPSPRHRDADEVVHRSPSTSTCSSDCDGQHASRAGSARPTRCATTLRMLKTAARTAAASRAASEHDGLGRRSCLPEVAADTSTATMGPAKPPRHEPNHAWPDREVTYEDATARDGEAGAVPARSRSPPASGAVRRPRSPTLQARSIRNPRPQSSRHGIYGRERSPAAR